MRQLPELLLSKLGSGVTRHFQKKLWNITAVKARQLNKYSD